MPHAEQYVGVDWTDSLHNTKAGISADLNKPLPIGSEVVDKVVSLSVREDLCELQAMLKEAFRIMKTGRGVVLQVPMQSRTYKTLYSLFFHPSFGLRRLFDKAGLVELLVKLQSVFLTAWLIKLKYCSLSLIHGSSVLRYVSRLVLRAIGYLGHKAALYLDNPYKNWVGAALGYFVTARKL